MQKPSLFLREGVRSKTSDPVPAAFSRELATQAGVSPLQNAADRPASKNAHFPRFQSYCTGNVALASAD